MMVLSGLLAFAMAWNGDETDLVPNRRAQRNETRPCDRASMLRRNTAFDGLRICEVQGGTGVFRI
jgi:hypothetical protein